MKFWVEPRGLGVIRGEPSWHAFTESPLELESAVRRTVGAGMQQQLLNIPSWRGFNNPWMAEDDQDIEFSYINLIDNPERYTGYKVCHLCITSHRFSSNC